MGKKGGGVGLESWKAHCSEFWAECEPRLSERTKSWPSGWDILLVCAWICKKIQFLLTIWGPSKTDLPNECSILSTYLWTVSLPCLHHAFYFLSPQISWRHRFTKHNKVINISILIIFYMHLENMGHLGIHVHAFCLFKKFCNWSQICFKWTLFSRC